MTADYITTLPRDAQERRGKIRTFTGRYVNPLAMQPEDVDIRDIAHHLAMVCRYTGACPHHYSVAQHSVLVATTLMLRGGNLELQMAGLLHDSSEYVLNDIASPVKADPRMAWYRELDHETTRMIYSVYGVDPALLEQTKQADDDMFHREASTWWGNPDDNAVQRWEPDDAERIFLEHFHALQEMRHGH